MQRHSPVVEHNVSYTRSVQTPPLDLRRVAHEYVHTQAHLVQQNSCTLRLNHPSSQASSQIGQIGHSYSVEQHLDNQISRQMKNLQEYSDLQQSHIQTLNSSVIEGDVDEDARFIRLAHEALVATSTESNLIVDLTIQDLLTKLRYALSLCENPVRETENIHANENGQLMIQKPCKNFPNQSDDILGSMPDGEGSVNDYDSINSKNEDWNFYLEKASPGPSTENSNNPESTSMRNFSCNICEMSFNRSLDLKRHEKQHLKIPANICPRCGKGFARKDALKRHLGTLTCKRNASKRLYRHNLAYLN